MNNGRVNNIMSLEDPKGQTIFEFNEKMFRWVGCMLGGVNDECFSYLDTKNCKKKQY